jgi:glyoxylase-like metal-dependent hydrolase (beta-lactamase superfamily II)
MKIIISVLLAGACLTLFGNSIGLINDTPSIRVTKLTDNLYKLFVNDFVNMVAFIGGEGVLLVDSGFEETATSIKEKLRELGNNQIKYLINTHADLDHYGGNSKLGEDAVIIAHERSRALLEEKADFPKNGLPHLTFLDKITLHFNSETIDIVSLAGCHSGEDAIVHFTKANVVCLGDIINPDSFPVMWIERGASIHAFIAHIYILIKIFPANVRFVVGHGRDLNMKDLRDYRDMLIETMEIVLSAMKKGKSIEDMKNAKILQAYEGWNDKETDWINTEYWIETLAKSTKKNRLLNKLKKSQEKILAYFAPF